MRCPLTLASTCLLRCLLALLATLLLHRPVCRAGPRRALEWSMPFSSYPKAPHAPIGAHPRGLVAGLEMALE